MGAQHSSDFRHRGVDVHPVPGRRDHDGVDAGVIDGDPFALTLQHRRLGHAARQDLAHSSIGLDRDDVVRPSDQQARQRPRAGPNVDNPAGRRGYEPFDDRRAGTGPPTVIVVGNRAK